ncbi:MAG: phenylalanine--tRNA ligase beta subunit-related protein [Ilumatobacter sp.]
MWSVNELGEWLAAVRIDPAIFDLRPDYCAGLMVVAGISSGPSDTDSDQWLQAADSCDIDLDDVHLEHWRDAYRSFGAKPNRTRPSADALSRRAEKNGLPRINKITDTYNAISVLQRIPIGVENLDAFVGPARLVRADGTEQFDTTNDGLGVAEHPEPGEPVWRDDTGVTCRRWNWRQTPRTAITDTTANALFIVDALGPDAHQRAAVAIDTLRTALATGTPSATRYIDTAD